MKIVLSKCSIANLSADSHLWLVDSKLHVTFSFWKAECSSPYPYVVQNRALFIIKFNYNPSGGP